MIRLSTDEQASHFVAQERAGFSAVQYFEIARPLITRRGNRAKGYPLPSLTKKHA
jgi:hypothetical protein